MAAETSGSPTWTRSLSGSVMIWRFRPHSTLSPHEVEQREQRAIKLVGYDMTKAAAAEFLVLRELLKPYEKWFANELWMRVLHDERAEPAARFRAACALALYDPDAKDWERINDWIERIGWPRFFEKTGLPFTKYHIDNWRGARNSLNASTHIRF